MDMEQIEIELIEALKQNIEDCGDKIPDLDSDSALFGGVPGFDSLRAIEVLMSLEEKVGCELPIENVFTKKPSGSDSIKDLVKSISKIIGDGKNE